MKISIFTVIIILSLITSIAEAALHSKVDADLEVYDNKIKSMQDDFLKSPANPQDKEWVKGKLNHMVEIDQYMRFFTQTPFEHHYTKEEKEYFDLNFSDRFKSIDLSNTSDIKDLLKIYRWFKISEFGKKADNQAWLLVQHADLDSAFQKEVLITLEQLFPLNETSPSNYAYLYDRVATAWNNQSERKLQRYGTQGKCTGPGTWEALPSEDPDKLDQKRATVGLGSMEEYRAAFKELCK